MTLALAFLSLAVSTSAQNLILNGGFELPGLPANQPSRSLSNGDTYIAGWTVVDDGTGDKSMYVQGPSTDAIQVGNYGLLLNQGSGVRTTFRAAAPSFYELSFWLRPSSCKLCVSPAPLQVTINENVYTIPLIQGWAHPTIQFYTTNSINTLELLNASSPSDYKQFGLDEVTITTVKGSLLAFRFYPGVILNGIVGQHYDIQAAPDLSAPTWTTLTNIFLTNSSPYIFIDMDPKRPLDYPPPRRLYRAIQVP